MRRGSTIPFDEVHEAELVEPLPAILSAAARWTPWAEVRAAAAARADEADDEAAADDDVDELLLTLLDDGLLQSDLSPPIVGAAPGEHLRARLDALGEGDAARAVDQANAALAAGDLARGTALLAGLPGGDAAAAVHAVLVHRPRSAPTLERAAVERAAALAPLLVRLQDALAPPAAERFAQPALADGLDAATELQGGGAFDVAALATGDYGVELHDDGADDAPHRPPDAAVLTLVLDAIAEAARGRLETAAIDRAALSDALRDVPGPQLPCSAELFLAPVPRRPGKPAGTGWLLGLHAPAGASLGRFGHALGGGAKDALAALEAAERQARPHEQAVDVAFAPARALTDLATRPRTSRRTLALTRWSGDDDAELAPAALELVADPDAPDALALREHATGAPNRSGVARALALGHRACRDRPPARRVEPVAPARVLGAAARPARAADVRSAALPRRIRDRAGELAAARRPGHARGHPALAAGRGGAAARAAGRRRRAAAHRPRRAGRRRRSGRSRSRCSRSGRRSTGWSIATAGASRRS